jgi:lipopolysaccharide export LptBFGC system permease protein LptF
MGIQGNLDPLLAAWLPVLLFGSLGLVLYDSMQS